MLLLFAALMIFAAYRMIRKNRQADLAAPRRQSFHYPLIVAEGAGVGLLTGLVGAGGGFLLIPALVVLGRLPMKEAVGTSLVIIAANSLIGFGGEVGKTAIDWLFLLQVTAFAIAGIFAGTALAKKIEGATLRPAFGWFVLVMGIYIILKETIIH